MATPEKKSYADKLKDPRWQKMRLHIMQRDGFACTRCGSEEKTLHVHHTFYDYGKDPWDYDAGSLKTLCESCHAIEEKAKSDVTIIIGILIKDGFAHLDLCNILSKLLQLKSDISPRAAADKIRKFIDSELFDKDKLTGR